MNSKLLPSIIVVFLSGYAILNSIIPAKDTAGKHNEHPVGSNQDRPVKAVTVLPEESIIRYPSMVYLDM